jgi:hypothetical protein
LSKIVQEIEIYFSSALNSNLGSLNLQKASLDTTIFNSASFGVGANERYFNLGVYSNADLRTNSNYPLWNNVSTVQLVITQYGIRLEKLANNTWTTIWEK